MTKPIKAELSLQRSNQDHKTISLRLRFGTGKTVTVGMKPYDFALMVTGMSDVDCQVELRNVRIEMESQFRLVLREEQPDCDCAEDDTSCDCWDHPTYSLYLNGMQGYGSATWCIDTYETQPRYWCNFLGLETFAVDDVSEIPDELRKRLVWLGDSVSIKVM
jgi:hypothetical protein